MGARRCRHREGHEEVELEGLVEVLHEDRDAGSRYLYFLEAGGRRYTLHFAGETPALLTGTRIRVKGDRVGLDVALSTSPGPAGSRGRPSSTSRGMFWLRHADGARFTVRLPLPGEGDATGVARCLDGLRVPVVDDDQAAREVGGEAPLRGS